MIDPLRFNKETALAYEINRPSFCNSCLSTKATRNNPNVATKFCSECPSAIGHAKDYGAFLCKTCDESIHDKVAFKTHVRQIVVVGPGVRKKVVVRGDTVNYPCPLDHVKIRVKAKIYHGGRRIHREPATIMSYVAGTSGKTLHVQVLGARNLVAGDIGGLSDPFVVYSFCGKTLGSTRVRPRSLNPRWNNETFIIPMDDHLPNPRDLVMSQKDLFKLEVFDFDWFSQNEFLGHLEITKSKLMKMAVVANQQPIRLPLSTKESHGNASFKIGVNKKHFYFRMIRAENLDKQDPILLSNPYVKVFLGFDDALMGTTSVIYTTVNPEWGNKSTIGNEFKVKIEHILAREKQILSNISINREMGAHSGSGKYDEKAQHLNLIRFELYNSKRLGRHTLLGKCGISVEEFRKLLPTFPVASQYNLEKYSKFNQNLVSAVVQSSVWSTVSDYFTRKSDYAPVDLQQDLNVVGSGMDTSSNNNNGVLSASRSRSRVTAGGVVSGGGDIEMGEINSEEHSQSNSHSANPTSTPGAALRKTKSSRSMMNSFMGLPAITLPVIEEVMWSNIVALDVLQTSTKAKGGVNSIANGQIIVRLLPSSRGSVIVGLDDAVRQMSIGEKAHVKCRYDYAYNNYCMGSNIPPRSNIIFTVELLEINGHGRFGAPWRQCKRMFRVVRHFALVVYAYITKTKPPEPEIETHHSSKKKSMKKSRKHRRHSSIVDRISMFFGQPSGRNGDSDSDSDSEDGDDDDDLGNFGDGMLDQNAFDGAGTESERTREKKLRVDPRLKKHMNQSVKSGAQLFWGYVPPPPKPRKSNSQNKLIRESSKRSVALTADDVIVDGGGVEGEEKEDQQQQLEYEAGDDDDDEDDDDNGDDDEDERLLGNERSAHSDDDD